MSIREEIEKILKVYENRYAEAEKWYKDNENTLNVLKKKRDNITMVTTNMIITSSALVCILYSGVMILSTRTPEALPYEMILAASIKIYVIAIAAAIIQGWYRNKKYTKQIKDMKADRPSREWYGFYDRAGKVIESLDRNGAENLLEIDWKPQPCTSKFDLKASCDAGVVGMMTVSAKDGTPFLVSMRGKGSPATEKAKETSLPLDSRKAIAAWENMPHFNIVEIPYVKIQLFPNTITSGFRFLIPRTEDPEDLEDALGKMCLTIAYDIMRRQLLRGLTEDLDTWDAGISEEECAPYFTKRDHEQDPEDLQKAYKDAENAVKRAMAISAEMFPRIPYGEE